MTYGTWPHRPLRGNRHDARIGCGEGYVGVGGLNVDAKVRRESVHLEDLFLAQIGSMDTFARGLKNAARLVKSGAFDKILRKRCASYDRGIGAKIEKGNTSLTELEKWVMEAGEPRPKSEKQEKCELALRQYTGRLDAAAIPEAG